MTDLTVANTIRDQIKALSPSALMSWGAKRLIGHNDGLQFQVNGLKHKGIVFIKLNGRDLYDIEIGRVRLGEWISVNKKEDIYCDQLVEILDELIEGRQYDR